MFASVNRNPGRERQVSDGARSRIGEQIVDPRQSTKSRKTNETDIRVSLSLDGKGDHRIATGIPFFDHMLAQIARHGHFDLEIEAKGDLEIDGHHTVEDVGWVLGQSLREALGDRRGIVRFGHAYVPLEEGITSVVIGLYGCTL